MDPEYIFEDDDNISIENLQIDDSLSINDVSHSSLINLYNAFKREKNLQLRDYICNNRPDILDVLDLDDITIYEKDKKEIMYDIKQIVKYSKERINVTNLREFSKRAFAKTFDIFYVSLITAFTITLYNIATKNGKVVQDTIDGIKNVDIKIKSKNEQVNSISKKYMLKELNTIETTLDKFISKFIKKKMKVKNEKDYKYLVNQISTTIEPLEDIIGFELLSLENKTYKISMDKTLIDESYKKKKSFMVSLKFKGQNDINVIKNKLMKMQKSMETKHIKLLEDIESIVEFNMSDSDELKSKREAYFNKEAMKFQYSVLRILIRGKSESMKKISQSLENLIEDSKTYQRPEPMLARLMVR